MNQIHCPHCGKPIDIEIGVRSVDRLEELEKENASLKAQVESLRNDIVTWENVDADRLILDLQNRIDEQEQKMKNVQKWIQDLIAQLPPEVVKKVKMP